MRNLYDESRRFKTIFPDFDIFTLNTIPYLFEPEIVDNTNLLIIYNRLKLQYDNSFFAYERIGTIYQKNAERVNKMLLYLYQYKNLKDMVNDKNTNIDTAEFYDTDNEENADVIGSLTSKTINKNNNYETYNRLLAHTASLLNSMDREIEKYQSLLLNDLYYKRGGIFDE